VSAARWNVSPEADEAPLDVDDVLHHVLEVEKDEACELDRFDPVLADDWDRKDRNFLSGRPRRGPLRPAERSS